MLNNHIRNQQDKLFSFLTELWFTKASYTEEDITILLTSFVHKSYASDFLPALDHNERLEFLWDSILGACIASLLYQEYPEWSEATMTLYKISLVREETLALVAREIKLWQQIFLSKWEERQWWANKDSILADSLEALIGACYLVFWRTSVYWFIKETIWNHIEVFILTNNKSYKSLIQERSQQQWFELPHYISTTDKSSEKSSFVSMIYINNILYGSGHGRNKKKSQEEAAKQAYLNRNKIEKDKS